MIIIGITGSSGSGKTTVIVERIKKLISKDVNPETFLVITFTRKAAENLQLKLKKELDKKVSELNTKLREAKAELDEKKKKVGLFIFLGEKMMCQKLQKRM